MIATTHTLLCQQHLQPKTESSGRQIDLSVTESVPLPGRFESQICLFVAPPAFPPFPKDHNKQETISSIILRQRQRQCFLPSIFAVTQLHGCVSESFPPFPRLKAASTSILIVKKQYDNVAISMIMWQYRRELFRDLGWILGSFYFLEQSAFVYVTRLSTRGC